MDPSEAKPGRKADPPPTGSGEKEENTVDVLRERVVGLVKKCEDIERLKTVMLLLSSPERSSASFLKECRLIRYTKTFDDMGYMDADTLQELSEEKLVDVLRNQLKMKPGHVAKLKKWLRDVKQRKSDAKKKEPILASAGRPLELWSFEMEGFQAHKRANGTYTRAKELRLGGRPVWAILGCTYFLYYSKTFANWRVGRKQDLEKIKGGEDLAVASSNDNTNLDMIIKNDKEVGWKEWSGRWLSCPGKMKNMLFHPGITDEDKEYEEKNPS